MSRRGNCYDNAPIESFWGTLKTELVHQCRFETRQQAIQQITDYIELFYNPHYRRDRDPGSCYRRESDLVLRHRSRR